jgi:hypothetical protein
MWHLSETGKRKEFLMWGLNEGFGGKFCSLEFSCTSVDNWKYQQSFFYFHFLSTLHQNKSSMVKQNK